MLRLPLDAGKAAGEKRSDPAPYRVGWSIS